MRKRNIRILGLILMTSFLMVNISAQSTTHESNSQPKIPVSSLPKPTKEQAKWQDYEIGVFYHYDMNVFKPERDHRKYDDFPKPELFNPTNLDMQQWMEVTKALDAKYAVLTATHGSGFMLWQSDAYPYGMKQVKELWGNYGKLAEIWFDGGLPDPKAGYDVLPYAKKLQPKALIYGGGNSPVENIRWLGWEKGKTGYPCWATGTVPFDTKMGSPDGKDWCPGEADVDMLGGAWMWSPKSDEKLLSINELMDIYYKSVGHNCNLLINAAPGPDGRISEAQLMRFREFGQEIKRRFGTSLAETSGRGSILELPLVQPKTIDHVILMEQIAKGERVRDYVIEGKVGDQWQKIGGGSCIGHKRIEKITPVEVSAVRLRIIKSVGEPIIRKLAVYNTSIPPKDVFGNLITSKTAADEQAIKTSLKSETPKQREERMRWFTDGRFGMFIHWGVYAVPAGAYGDKKGCGEWLMENAKIPVSKYEQFAQQFNPVKFDAKEWVRIAQDAGMKYMVITAKHHDGFSMYRTDLSDWSIKSTPFQRDPMKELAYACKDAGIKLCFYYSIMDWQHPDWPERREWNDRAKGVPDMNRYTEFMKGQLTELLTRYGPIGILWFDGDTEKPWSQEAGFDLYYYLRSIQPNLIINNRIAKARDIKTDNPAAGDFGTPEQRIPKEGQVPTLPWESCMTINETWGFDKSDQEFKSSRTLVRNLVECAAKGGNFLLNVGPTDEGLIPEKSVERLSEIGEWMKINSEAIYGTVAAKIEGLPSGCLATKKGDKIYLHLFEWPEKIFVPVNRQVRNAYLIANPKLKVEIKTGPNNLSIKLPVANPGKIATVLCLEMGEPLHETVIQAVNQTVGVAHLANSGTIRRSEQPADCPFPKSESIGSVLFTGRHAEYTSADTWYPSWATDGNLYSPWTDGKVNGLGVFSGGPNAATGNATITGDDPMDLKVINQAIYKSDPRPYGGRYPCGSMVYNGVWYYGTYCLAESGSGLNWDILGPFVGFRYSTDFGKTWVQTPCTPEKPLFPEPAKFKGPVRLGSPHFVDFGKNMEHSPDGKAYLVGHGATSADPKPREAANASWITGDQIFLTRVKPDIKNINNVSKYEFFAGNNPSGKPVWASEFKKIKPIADWNNNMGCVTITYNAPLKKYFMCVTDGVNTMTKYNTYILESSTLTGPWKMVTYLKSFGEAAYFVNIPTKFISADGLTMWLCYSANWMDQKNKRYHAIPDGSRYSMCLQEIKLLPLEKYTIPEMPAYQYPPEQVNLANSAHWQWMKDFYKREVSQPASVDETPEQVALRAARVKPTPEKLAYLDMELITFPHFGMSTVSGHQQGTGKEDPRSFNPTKFNAREWVRFHKAIGAKMIVFVAKHHDGYTLWPSRLNDYNIRSSPWRDGKGDMVKEIADACREGGVKLGLYISLWDEHDPRCDHPRNGADKMTPAQRKTYQDYVEQQLMETLIPYGEISELWFDGAGSNGAEDWNRIFEIVHYFQPKCLVAMCGFGVRWCGNESAVGDAVNWNVLPLLPELRKHEWVPYHFGQLISKKLPTVTDNLENLKSQDLFFIPQEGDTRVLNGGWHWDGVGEPRSLEFLINQ